MITTINEWKNNINQETPTIEEIETVLQNVLPKEIIVEVFEYKIFDPYIGIKLYTSEKTINNVRGQHPDIVSLSLNLVNLELKPQAFGGSGGQWVYRHTDSNIEREKYLALGREKVPFRRPKPEKNAILKAIERFAVRYIEILKNIKDRDLISNSNKYLEIDYSFLN